MAISNSASGFRPGVCTSTTRPTAPFNGQVIYETDTKQTLVWQGSAWVMLTDADTPPGLQLVKTQTVGTAVSSVTVSDAFSSSFDNYRIVYNGGTSSTNASLTMALGSSTTGYYAGFMRVVVSTAGVTGLSDNNTTKWNYVGYASTTTVALSLDLINPFAAQPTVYHGGGWVLTADAGISNGIHNVSTSYTSFIIGIASGTLTGGTIRVYGYRNS